MQLEMDIDTLININCEQLVRCFHKLNGSLFDHNNIVWKVVDGEWIGKRAVYTFDNSACWLEDTNPDNIKSWLCGRDADYEEIIYRKN